MNPLRNMAAALGGDVVNGRGGLFILCPGPGHSAKDRSLSVAPSATDPDGFVCFSHARDAWQDCRDHVRARIGGRPSEYRETAKRQAKRQEASTDNSARARQLWGEAVEPRGTLAERYLNNSRGLELTDDVADRVVRFHGACPWRRDNGEIERRPVMLTVFRSITDDKIMAVHRTLLSDDGRKLDRRMLGPVGGAAIKIDIDSDVEYGLTICEGFETGLAGRALGFRPVWAVGSAGAIAEFPVMAGINALTIMAETDDSGANAKAVRTCGNRWAAATQEIIIAAPRVVGDMNDAWRSQ
jgi:putative DNA primase/helicase